MGHPWVNSLLVCYVPTLAAWERLGELELECGMGGASALSARALSVAIGMLRLRFRFRSILALHDNGNGGKDGHPQHKIKSRFPFDSFAVLRAGPRHRFAPVRNSIRSPSRCLREKSCQ